jgi:hypothetical protein
LGSSKNIFGGVVMSDNSVKLRTFSGSGIRETDRGRDAGKSRKSSESNDSRGVSDKTGQRESSSVESGESTGPGSFEKVSDLRNSNTEKGESNPETSRNALNYVSDQSSRVSGDPVKEENPESSSVPPESASSLSESDIELMSDDKSNTPDAEIQDSGNPEQMPGQSGMPGQEVPGQEMSTAGPEPVTEEEIQENREDMEEQISQSENASEVYEDMSDEDREALMGVVDISYQTDKTLSELYGETDSSEEMSTNEQIVELMEEDKLMDEDGEGVRVLDHLAENPHSLEALSDPESLDRYYPEGSATGEFAMDLAENNPAEYARIYNQVASLSGEITFSNGDEIEVVPYTHGEFQDVNADIATSLRNHQNSAPQPGDEEIESGINTQIENDPELQTAIEGLSPEEQEMFNDYASETFRGDVELAGRTIPGGIDPELAELVENDNFELLEYADNNVRAYDSDGQVVDADPNDKVFIAHSLENVPIEALENLEEQGITTYVFDRNEFMPEGFVERAHGQYDGNADALYFPEDTMARGTVIHEYGHAIDGMGIEDNPQQEGQEYPGENMNFSSYNEETLEAFVDYRERNMPGTDSNPADMWSHYAGTNVIEYTAEAFRMYYESPETREHLQQRDPAAYEWIEEMIENASDENFDPLPADEAVRAEEYFEEHADSLPDHVDPEDLQSGEHEPGH